MGVRFHELADSLVLRDEFVWFVYSGRNDVTDVFADGLHKLDSFFCGAIPALF